MPARNSSRTASEARRLAQSGGGNKRNAPPVVQQKAQESSEEEVDEKAMVEAALKEMMGDSEKKPAAKAKAKPGMSKADFEENGEAEDEG